MKLRLRAEKRTASGPGRSERKGISLPDLLNMFPNEKSARKWFENVRWSEGRFCAHCGGLSTYKVATGKPLRYRCRDCRRYFSVRTGTVMQSSKLPLRTWAFGVYLMSTSLKGVSSMKLHRDLGITQKTAWMMAHKIREGWKNANSGKLDGEVEVDETYVGGLERNKHWNKRTRAGRGTVGKHAIVGAKSRRSRRVVAAVIDTPDRKTLHKFLAKAVKRGSTLYTDEHSGYDGLDSIYKRGKVRHSVGQYVADGNVHTNGIESFWAPLKRAHKGVYHKMSKKHLHRYANEFAGRHNLRDMDTIDQMKAVVLGMELKRLTWRMLTR